MSFVGLVPSESSTGGSVSRGAITKAGNSHVRRLLVEAAWHHARPLGATTAAARAATPPTSGLSASSGLGDRLRGPSYSPEEICHFFLATTRL